MNFNWENQEHEWRKHLLSDARGEILEIAVGMGDNFKYYPSHAVVTATDTSAKVIEKAKEEAKTRSINAVFLVSPIEELQLPEKKFDTIVSTFSLSAFTDPLWLLNQFSKWCKPGGLVLLLEYGLSKCKLIGWCQHKLHHHYYCKTGCHFDRDIIKIISDSQLSVRKIEVRCAGTIYMLWTSTTLPASETGDLIKKIT